MRSSASKKEKEKLFGRLVLSTAMVVVGLT
jgi:hypothetical protein